MQDVRFRDRLARLEVELMALEITNLRFLDRMRRTGQPPAPSVDAEDQGHRDPAGAHRAGVRRDGPDGERRILVALRKRYLSMRKTTIYAGSNEIQRNIISKMTLGCKT